ncbi:F protein [Mount Mabu Lophuromys virus 1]|uniref:Fusion glycoprotein F0 n=1 Tax=Mount Mabu Lophuromys virus 1 TaxID=2116559 RepID=A0A2P1GJ78_9MONO|nr:F protein [Mount Mabu Lophuromys virus 1]AVM86016.1 F protein [Mount Mabu Lophuromys virus 1]
MKHRRDMLMTKALLIIIILIGPLSSQISFTNLSKIGVIKGKNYKLKITSNPTYQFMVLKMIPNVVNMSQCGQDHLDNYKGMLKRILQPISDSINLMRSVIQDKPNNGRFWGALVGGVALGVATSAQVTAGVALHNSLENARAILQLKDAIQATNQAVQEVISAQRKSVLVINALQDQINGNIVPAIKSLGCKVAGNTFGLRLTQYFSEVSLVFGPNLRDPAAETLSIQAISRAFNGDFDSLLKALGYKESDLMDVLESGSIRGRIIDVSLDNYFLIIQIEYPTLVNIPDATVQKFNLISYNYDGSEWLSVFPKALLKRGSYLSNIDLSDCTQTTNTILCPQDTSSPLTQNLYDCATGKISQCARMRVVNSHVSRYALSDGVLFLNCIPINCRCSDPEYAIIQEPTTTTLMMSYDDCREVMVEGIFVTVGKKTLNRTSYTGEVDVGGIVTLDPIDISTDVADIQDTLDKAQEEIDKSNEILSKVNPNIITLGGFVSIISFTTLFGIYCVVSLIWLICLTKRTSRPYAMMTFRNRSPTITTLSSNMTS